MAQAADRVITAIQNVLTQPIRPPSTSAAREAHALYMRAVMASPPYSIHGDADAADLANAADRIEAGFLAFGLYMTALLDDIAHKTSLNAWRVDRELIELLYRRVAEGAAKGLRRSAEAMAEIEDERRAS